MHASSQTPRGSAAGPQVLKLKLFPLQILLIQSLEKTNSQTSETHLPSKKCIIFRNVSCSSSKMIMKVTLGLADILGSGNKKPLLDLAYILSSLTATKRTVPSCHNKLTLHVNSPFSGL